MYELDQHDLRERVTIAYRMTDKSTARGSHFQGFYDTEHHYRSCVWRQILGNAEEKEPDIHSPRPLLLVNSVVATCRLG